MLIRKEENAKNVDKITSWRVRELASPVNTIKAIAGTRSALVWTKSAIEFSRVTLDKTKSALVQTSADLILLFSPIILSVVAPDFTSFYLHLVSETQNSPAKGNKNCIFAPKMIKYTENGAFLMAWESRFFDRETVCSKKIDSQRVYL